MNAPWCKPEFKTAACILRGEKRPREINREVIPGDKVCFACRKRVNSAIAEDSPDAQLNVILQHQTDLCIICEADANVRRVPFSARVDVFLNRDIYIPPSSKICPGHLSEDNSKIQDWLIAGLQSFRRFVPMKGREAGKWMEALRTHARRTIPTRFSSPDNFSATEFFRVTGLEKQQFAELEQICQPVMLYGTRRIIYTKDLILFLCKMRHGLSDDFMKVLFELRTRSAASLTVKKVRLSLMENFVPRHLGLNSITRDEFIARHVTDFANALFNPDREVRKPILIIDGTYLKIPKSSNYRVLRQSFCSYKNYHCVKPILIVASNGYILDVHGPYFSDSRNNDGNILVDQLRQDIGGFRTWLQDGDIFIVDRGYRDGMELLRNLGIQVYMPGFALNEHRQGSWEDANNSRLVTSLRWLVEARNGHLKSFFKFLRDPIHPHHIPNIGDFFRIGCAIINAFRPEILQRDAGADRAQLMLDRMNHPNSLEHRVHEGSWIRQRRTWEAMDGSRGALLQFPQLSMQYLRDITFGSYQVRLSRGYASDMLSRDGGYQIKVSETEDDVFRALVSSRFSNAKRHHVFISFISERRPQDERGNPIPWVDMNPIDEYYCTCRTGARTLGCCAHVASVMWYMGYARHQPNIVYPPQGALNTMLDAARRPVNAVVEEVPQIVDPPNALLAGQEEPPHEEE